MKIVLFYRISVHKDPTILLFRELTLKYSPITKDAFLIRIIFSSCLQEKVSCHLLMCYTISHTHTALCKSVALKIFLLIFWEFKIRNISQILQQKCRNFWKAIFKIMNWGLKRRMDFFQHNGILSNLQEQYLTNTDLDSSWEVSHYVALLLGDHSI